MLTFRDVQKVVIERALREARQQLPLEARLRQQMSRQGAPLEPVGSNNTEGVLRADDQALDAPGVVLGD